MNDVSKRFCICEHNFKITSINRKSGTQTVLAASVLSCYFIILIHLLYLRPHENPALQSLATFLPGF